MRYWRAGFFLGVIGVEATALHHEVANHTVKNCSVVVFVFNVLQKVFDCFWGFVGVDLHDEIALGRNELDLRGFLRERRYRQQTECKTNAIE